MPVSQSMIEDARGVIAEVGNDVMSLLMIDGWHHHRLNCGFSVKVSMLGREVAVMMDWPSSSCVMKGRFVGI